MTRKELQVRDEGVLKRTIDRCRDRNILLPTFKQLANPELIPAEIKKKLKDLPMQEVHPLNLFRLTWKNEPTEKGGLFGGVNHIILPPSLTGVPCQIAVLVGHFFPTNAHKVGATYGPLTSRLVTGGFDPEKNIALWPSTGNYCRGGAYNSALLDVPCIAVLPEEMSEERFNWLKKIKTQIVATPGGESNVKEIFDKTKELCEDPKIIALNQFSEFTNPIFHYYCTGRAMEEVFEGIKASGHPNARFSGLCLTQGSAGCIASADYIKEQYPRVKIAGCEALQCPTLTENGFGAHKIEGIGDKHVPWVHNVKTMDMVIDIDDDDCMRIARLFNEPEGHDLLIKSGVPRDVVAKLPLMGISGIANMLSSIKMAKYYEFTSDDVMVTVATDAMSLYESRLVELRREEGPYTHTRAAVDFERSILAQNGRGHLEELTYWSKKRMHNLKYFTWIEQQGQKPEELNAMWYDPNYWTSKWNLVEDLDVKIEEFNKKTGLHIPSRNSKL
eukprot:GFYU01013402.1.p1 GENE.GFYU01013402.1~~GFYU01013402.1.p1  ORF type:complete len:501 (-),score=176.68 GFYU01013402.1:65-1567(-)